MNTVMQHSIRNLQIFGGYYYQIKGIHKVLVISYHLLPPCQFSFLPKTASANISYTLEVLARILQKAIILLSLQASDKSWSIMQCHKNVITTPNTGEEYLFGIEHKTISCAMICIMLQSGNSYTILLINCDLMNDK